MHKLNRLRVMPRHLVTYHGQGFLITGLDGLIGGGVEGFYFRQTRFLSRLRLRIDDSEPTPVSANPVGAHTAVAYFLAPSPAGAAAGPEAERGKEGGEMVRRGIEVQCSTLIAGGLRYEVVVTNHALADAELVLRWQFDADFADLSEAAKGEREQQAPVERSWGTAGGGGTLRFRYTHPELDHGCEIRLSGAGTVSDDGAAVVWSVKALPQTPVRLRIDIAPVFCGEPIGVVSDAALAADPTAAMRAPALQLETGNALVQSAWDRAAADFVSLALLDGEGSEQRTPAAGIPKYSALFGRDVLVAGFQAGFLDPESLFGTLRLIAKWNATEYDDAYDAQPGRVIHQRQQSPLALLRKNPFLHYYGDYSAPAWFLIDNAWAFAMTGDRDFYLSMRDKILGTLEWMDRDGDRDHDGFYEYDTKAGDWGEKNQGWKDSEEAVLYPDGQLVPNPIALIEIQGCYYAAKQMTGLAFAALGDERRAARLWAEAEALKRRFNEHFWMPEAGYLAMALDPAKNRVETIASDPGQCLAYGILDSDKAGLVADRLMSPELFSGWGIRTLSVRHPAFNPFAYHLGSVWPVANALIAFGFKRHGFDAHLHRLAKAMFEASRLFEHDRLPEVFGGHQRDAAHPHPGIYPEANAPQAWSASAVVLLVHAMLGLVPLAPLDTLIIDPDLPDWLSEVTLRDLQIGKAALSLRFRRGADGRTQYEILDQKGRLGIHRAAPREPGIDRLGHAVREVIAKR